MRKYLLAAGVAAVLALGTVAAASPETFGGLPVVRVVVNGKTLDVPGVVVADKTMAPVRAVAESLGGTVGWDEATATATISAPDAGKLQAESAGLRADKSRLEAENASLKAENDKLKADLAAAQAAAAAVPVGFSQSKPAPLGSTLEATVTSMSYTHTSKLTLLEVVRGDAFKQQLDPLGFGFGVKPLEGTEFVGARFKIQLVSLSGSSAFQLKFADFQTVQPTGMAVSIEQPKTKLTVGATDEIWVVFTVAKEDAAPVISYGRKADGSGGIWFSLKGN